MMEFSPNSVAKIIQLNDGKLIGKTRLQKTAYFLEELDAGFGFDFDYHYYGPYSEDLSVSLDGANALKMISLKWETTNSGAKYAVFESSQDFEQDEQDERRLEILSILKKYKSIVLELAATADFLSKNGFENCQWEETASRKPEKATDARVEDSKELLAKIQKIQ